MDEKRFWTIIESAGAPDSCTPREQCESIVAKLSQWKQQDLIDFENIRRKLMNKLYTWPILKANFIVLSYVSDDVFEDFRNWIILNGNERYTRTLENPDCMAEYIDVDDPVEKINGEPLMFVVEEAWDGDIEDIEREVVYPNDPDLGNDWPSKELLKEEFPNLFDKYWDEERIKRFHPD